MVTEGGVLTRIEGAVSGFEERNSRRGVSDAECEGEGERMVLVCGH